jgi:hypothetical protein
VPAGPDDAEPGRATMRVAWGVPFAAPASIGVELAGPGDCMRALWAKAVMALRARLLAIITVAGTRCSPRRAVVVAVFAPQRRGGTNESRSATLPSTRIARRGERSNKEERRR